MNKEFITFPILMWFIAVGAIYKPFYYKKAQYMTD